jgi:hypothetical protein
MPSDPFKKRKPLRPPVKSSKDGIPIEPPYLSANDKIELNHARELARQLRRHATLLAHVGKDNTVTLMQLANVKQWCQIIKGEMSISSKGQF